MSGKGSKDHDAYYQGLVEASENRELSAGEKADFFAYEVLRLSWDIVDAAQSPNDPSHRKVRGLAWAIGQHARSMLSIENDQ